jgi:8-oxo-dGTP diphosphatase
MIHVSMIQVVGAAIVQLDTCLVAQRGPSMKLAGKWEFPGGKVEPGEAPGAALAREILEELGLAIDVGELLGSGEAAAAGDRVRLDVYAAVIIGGALTLREHARVAWATAAALPSFDWAEADVPVVPGVAAFLRRRTR